MSTTEAIDIRGRMIWVIDTMVQTGHKHVYLEKVTGIGARKWQNVYHLVQQPSLEMVAAFTHHVCPSLTEWIIHGQVHNHHQEDPSEWKDEFGKSAYPDLISLRPKGYRTPEERKDLHELVEDFFQRIKPEPPPRSKKKKT